jgi:peptide/nickel transport system substrate-binding protein
MGRSRFIVGVVSVAALSLLLSACGSNSPSAAAKSTKTPAHVAVLRGGVVSYAETAGASPNYIFPVIPSADFTVDNLGQFQTLLYKPLWQSQANQPALDYPESIGNAPVWSDHDTVVTVTLKHYVWSDGDPVTTRDLTFFVNLARAAGPNWGEYIPGDFPYNVRSMKIESPTKMSFTLTEAYNPTYYLDNQLSELVPLPQQAWDREKLTQPDGNYDETPAGAKAVWNFLNGYAENTSTYAEDNPIWGVVDGPYKLKSFGGTASPDIFVPNPTYSGHRSTISEFEELPFTSSAAEYDVLRSGSSDLSYGYVPSSDIPTLAAVRSAGYEIDVAYGWDVDYIIPNLKNPTMGPVLSQLYIRQVIQHLTDQTAMIKDFMSGYGIPTYGPVPIYPRGNPFADAEEQHNPYPYSISTAKSILSSHGWKVVANGIDSCVDPTKCGKGIKKGTKLAFNLIYSSGSTTLTEDSELLEADAARAGVQISLRKEPFNTVVGVVTFCTPGKDGITDSSPQCTWQLGEYGGNEFGLYPSGGDLFLPGASENAGSYDNATLNRLIEAVRHSSGYSVFDQYENLVTTQLPWLWQPVPTSVVAVKSNLKGPGLVSEFGNLDPNRWYFVKS